MGQQDRVQLGIVGAMPDRGGRVRRWWRGGLWAVVFLPMLLHAQSVESPASTVEVIAHPSVKQDFLTRNFLRAIFTLRIRSWPDGEPIKIFVLGDGNELHTAFSREVLGTFPYVLRRTWDRTVFTGTGLVPRRVTSVDEMRQRVLSTPGAVGYVPLHAGDSSRSAELMTVARGGDI